MKHAILNADSGPVRTVLVLGVGRGGTSLVAGCLRALGLCMGRTPHPLKHEWSPVSLSPDGKIDLAATYRTIQDLDHEHVRWGWKSPRDVFQLDQLLPLLRDPGFVLVTRDLLEAALSGRAYQDVPLYISLDETALVYRAITTRLRFWPWPTLVIPFARALQEPAPLIDLLCSFLGLETSPGARQQAIDFVRPGENAYRLFDARPDDPPLLTSAEDLRADSQVLAAYLSSEYRKQYARQFETVLEETKKLAAALCVSALSLQNDRLELQERLGRIWAALPEDAVDDKQNGVAALHAARTGPEVRRGIDALLKQLSSAAKYASERVAQRTSDSGYNDLTRFYRTLQVLIRVRRELERAVQLRAFRSPA